MPLIPLILTEQKAPLQGLRLLTVSVCCNNSYVFSIWGTHLIFTIL